VANVDTPSPQDNHLKTFQALCEARALRWQLAELELHDAVDWLDWWACKNKIDSARAQAIMARAFAAVRDDLGGWLP
jgi:hypothetical protein